VSPSTCGYYVTYAIVFWVDIEEASLFDAVTSRILRKARDIDDAEA
jgi:hypothetical protein